LEKRWENQIGRLSEMIIFSNDDFDEDGNFGSLTS
jgi:hypothetical protein